MNANITAHINPNLVFKKDIGYTIFHEQTISKFNRAMRDFMHKKNKKTLFFVIKFSKFKIVIGFVCNIFASCGACLMVRSFIHE